MLAGRKITFFSCDSNGVIKELWDVTIQTKPSRGLGQGLIPLLKFYCKDNITFCFDNSELKLSCLQITIW